MTKEELIGKLQMVYVGDKNALNELIGYYDGLKQGIEIVQQEKQQLKVEENVQKEMIENFIKENQELKEKQNYDLKWALKYDELYKENQELKKQLEEYENELEKADSITQSCIFDGKKESEISFRKCLNMLEKHKNQQKEFINFIENEKDRLARECSQIYEDSLGKTRLVNEDIFNEVDTILSKYKKIIGDDK